MNQFPGVIGRKLGMTQIFLDDGSVVPCTNYITITQVSTNPPYAMIRVDCVWMFSDMGKFTNTVAVLRAPNL